MAIGIDANQLLRTVRGDGRPYPLFLRSYRGRVWTCATNGHAFVAVDMDLTENEEGPCQRWLRTVPARDPGTTVDLSKLREFLRIPRKPINHHGIEPIRVGGVPLNRKLIARALRPFPDGPVLLRSAPDRYYIRIDGDGWLAVVMGGIWDVPRDAVFRGGSRP